MKVIYINGIKTSKREANKQSAYLDGILRDEVTLCYNPSYGALVDLAESFYNRVVPWMPSLPVTHKLYRMIRESLKQHEKITVIAHSQGTAIAANALRKLGVSAGKRVNVIFFANINSHEPKNIIEGEIFLNDEDYVHSNLIVSNFFIRIGHWFKKPRNRWRKHTRRGNGHSFISEYLENLNEFTGFKGSNFYRLMKEEFPITRCE
jgi:hypothetical protein